ncbi:MAG: tripartite tricarboxylate transporter substrate-binding protein [Burkholderiaceae bacterium]|nr:tripartite tricarboxylate transporter substrate-binding protein [Burkholderiaceae bacterium]
MMKQQCAAALRTLVKALALLLVGGATLSPACAQSYPERSIRAVQGFAVGGNADAIARVVGAEMAKTLGQPLVIDAVTGAGGTLASAAVARAAPDGYTVLLATGGHAVSGAMYNKLPYQTVGSFQMVSTVTYFPFLIVVRTDSKLRTLQDLLAAAMQSADGLAYGSAGIGTTHHLAGELLAKTAKLKLLHIPYRGDAASTTAVLSSEVPFIIAPATAVEANIRAGRLRVLAVTGPQRWLGMPEVPTVAEQGVPGYDVRSWAGWMVPTGTPPTVIKRLNEATQQALLVPEVRTRLRQMGGEAQGSTPKEMTTLVEGELKKWTQIVGEAGIPKL